ncbi:MAG: hypothetical protein ACK2TW_06245 [Anaerolineales bacterium]
MQNKPPMENNAGPHILLVVARGEAVRNFLYSDTLPTLGRNGRVTLLSAIEDDAILNLFQEHVDRVIPLQEYPESRLVTEFRYILHMAHYRWLWYRASQYMWAADIHRAWSFQRKIKLAALKACSLPLASKTALESLTPVERSLTLSFCPTRDFDRIFTELKPDLIFNCSHIHGPLADLPMRTAYALGYKTAAFIFSWDNLYSRSRIFVPYNHYLVWTEPIREHLLELYPEIPPESVHVTGTPQFDFHFKPEFQLSRGELCKRIGIDPSRPYIFYTTGYTKDFPQEHKILEGLIRFLQNSNLDPKPQLVVRKYLKGNSPELEALSLQPIPDVVFPPVQWEPRWLTPLPEDLSTYTSMLRHASLGINAASTVSLELMMFDKPVVNLGFEPPGSRLEEWTRFSRHVEYEHYKPVAESGGVMVARSMEDLLAMVERGLRDPQADSQARQRFIREMFGDSLDGRCGERVANKLIELAKIPPPTSTG